jgi:hypothetical protein
VEREYYRGKGWRRGSDVLRLRRCTAAATVLLAINESFANGGFDHRQESDGIKPEIGIIARALYAAGLFQIAQAFQPEWSRGQAHGGAVLARHAPRRPARALSCVD